MRWMNQIQTDEAKVHIVEIKDIIGAIVPTVSNLLLYPILLYYFHYVIFIMSFLLCIDCEFLLCYFYYVMYFFKLIYYTNKRIPTN